MTSPLLGLSLLPDPIHLALMRRVIEEQAQLLEVTPETLWDEHLLPSPAHATVREIVARSGLPVIAHGTALSPGTPGEDDRLERHLAAVERDQAAFGFAWYSEHLGFTESGGLIAALPLPLPFTDEALSAVALRMTRLAAITNETALENAAALFSLGDPTLEPAFINAACEAAQCSLLLDLHDAHVNCRNFGLVIDDWIDALDLSRVIEIHISGGSDSKASWLTSRRVFRLDSHDSDVPDEVWAALNRVLPRCPGLRAVVLERNDESLNASNIEAFEREVARLRSLLC